MIISILVKIHTNDGHQCRPTEKRHRFYAGCVHSDKRNASAWCPSVCPSVPPTNPDPSRTSTLHSVNYADSLCFVPSVWRPIHLLSSDFCHWFLKCVLSALGLLVIYWHRHGQKAKTHFRQSSSRTELGKRHLRYSNHLWDFLGG